MSEKRYMVPEGMLKAAVAGLIHCWDRIPKSTDYSSKQVQLSTAACEAAIRWLAENPIVPTYEQMQDVDEVTDGIAPSTGDGYAKTRARCVEFQRRMFLAPEPEVPEVDPQKCPHRWQAKNDDATEERVVYCELCDWVYSRDSLAYRRGRDGK